MVTALGTWLCLTEGVRACSRTPKASGQASGMTLPCVALKVLRLTEGSQ